MHELAPGELSALLWSLAEANHAGTRPSLVAPLHMHAAAGFPSFDLIDLTKTILAFERLGWPPSAPWRALWLRHAAAGMRTAPVPECLYTLQAVEGLPLGLPDTAAQVRRKVYLSTFCLGTGRWQGACITVGAFADITSLHAAKVGASCVCKSVARCRNPQKSSQSMWSAATSTMTTHRHVFNIDNADLFAGDAGRAASEARRPPEGGGAAAYAGADQKPEQGASGNAIFCTAMPQRILQLLSLVTCGPLNPPDCRSIASSRCGHLNAQLVLAHPL